MTLETRNDNLVCPACDEEIVVTPEDKTGLEPGDFVTCDECEEELEIESIDEKTGVITFVSVEYEDDDGVTDDFEDLDDELEDEDEDEDDLDDEDEDDEDED